MKNSKIKDYWPLIVLVAMVMALSTIIHLSESRATLSIEIGGPLGGWMGWMHLVMGFFFCFLAMFKLFDLRGFVDGFSTYDLVSKKFREYGYLYPFLELGLGLCYLMRQPSTLLYMVTIALMALSSMGIVQSMTQKKKLHCACMGTVLKVPLSTVSLIEDAGMGVMALVMLLSVLGA